MSHIEMDLGSEKVRAYLAPSHTGTGPGIVVIQEWWGLVPHIEDICDRFAAEGFTALAPDLYGGTTTTDPDDAATMLQALHIGETESILRKAIVTLLADSSVSPHDKVGVVGFCMGGQLAMFAAGENPVVKATANFYGIHPKVQPSYRGISGRVLGIFAEHDDYASAEAVKALDMELTAVGVPHDFTTYPGTHHAFFNDTRSEVYDAAASADAWQKTLALFRSELI
ncbi:dienelactone hydrolase family protein [soil metagenome]